MKAEEFKEYLRELKHNRDYYTRAKIIELINEKFDKLQTKNSPTTANNYSENRQK